MKNTPLTICKKIGCKQYTRNSNHLCDTHQSSDRRAKWSHNAEAKKVYNSKRWKSTRAYKLQLNPLCEQCAKAGITTAANEVHHIDEDVNNWDLSNLMSLCTKCHRGFTVASIQETRR